MRTMCSTLLDHPPYLGTCMQGHQPRITKWLSPSFASRSSLQSTRWCVMCKSFSVPIHRLFVGASVLAIISMVLWLRWNDPMICGVESPANVYVDIVLYERLYHRGQWSRPCMGIWEYDAVLRHRYCDRAMTIWWYDDIENESSSARRVDDVLMCWYIPELIRSIYKQTCKYNDRLLLKTSRLKTHINPSIYCS